MGPQGRELNKVEKGKRIEIDLRPQNGIYCVARTVMEESVEGRITEELYNDIMESMRGFTEEIQLEIADDVVDFVCYRWKHETKLKTVDRLLKGLYVLIDQQLSHPEKFGLEGSRE